MTGRNVVIAGPPRSGTTLVCGLLDSLAGTVALHEPMNVSQLQHLSDRRAMADAVEQFFAEARNTILTEGKAVRKQRAPGMSLGELPAMKKPARLPVVRQASRIEKSLPSDFTLCIKHPGTFTALLDVLSERMACVAIVRNPLSVLASWNAIWYPFRKGHAPAAERLDPQLRDDLAAIDSKYERQLHLLGWYFMKCARSQPRTSVVRYEDIVATGGQALALVTPEASTLNEPLQSRNLSDRYNRTLMVRLGERLLKRDGAFWEFYDKSSVEELVQ